MKDHADNLLEAIQASGYRSAWVVTGGGIGAVHAMLGHAGASRFVMEVQVPYSATALEDYLGAIPMSACSMSTAKLLGERAFSRAEALIESDHKPIGIACTAALQTNRERKGSDRAFLAIKTSDQMKTQEVELDPDTRSMQDAVASGRLLALLAESVIGGTSS